MTRHWSAMVRGPSHCISRVHPYAHARTRARESIRRNGLVRGPLRTTYAELPLFKCDRPRSSAGCHPVRDEDALRTL
jgi:hypothetical protein